MKIRKPQIKDLTKIKEILAQWNDKEYTELYFNRVQNFINGSSEFDMRFWIAYDKDVLGITGLCDLSPDLLGFAKTSKPGQLKILFIDDSERGKGIGKYLIKFLENEAKKKYGELLIKSSEEYKKTAWGFYEKMGYAPIALIENKSKNKKSEIFEKKL